MTDCLTTHELNTVVLKHKCTNCMACYNICPSGAIEMKEDKDGFVYPFINEEKCTHCGLCTKKCPALNLEQTKEISERLETPLAYGGYIKDEEIREKSSSGGVFSILSKYVLDKGGYVCGARFTRGGICEHVIVDNWEDLAPLRGSKYVQSNINNCYKEIKNLLEQDKYVLFTGTPCQVAGLYAVLGKDYKKLITVDLLCHGVPSQKVFREYLNEITDNHADDVLNVNFKEKSLGWNAPSLSIASQNLSINIPNFYTNDDIRNSYGFAFVKNLILRHSCTDCQYSKLPRMGDFTMGDFWGVNHHKDKETLYDNKGLSAIFANSEKASSLIKILKNEFEVLQKVTIDSISKYNMVDKKSYPHPHSAFFREKYSKGEYSSLCVLIKECLEKKDGIALLNFADSKSNYGCNLTAYALQQKLRNKGYNPVNIIFYDNEKGKDLSNMRDFQQKFMNFTSPCPSFQQLENLNKYFQTFVVGSDCVWLNFDNGRDFNNYSFNFADFSKNICSYAASFAGKDLIRYRNGKLDSYTATEIKERKRLLKRFSHISVREDTGVTICKSKFDVTAYHVLDPVFLLRQDEWKKIIPQKVINSNAYKNVMYMIEQKNLSEGVYDFLKNLENIYSLFDGDNFSQAISNPAKFKASGPTIEEWLGTIAKCDTFYTDSFHGMCFAIIFNKQFITFNNCGPGYNRQQSLYRMLDIPDRTANSVEDIKRLLNEPIDYDKVNAKLQEHLKTSEEFLEKILYSHEHPDPVRGYMESLELLVEENSQKVTARIEQNFNEKLNKKEDKKPSKKTPAKEKWYFLGIHIFKKALLNGEQWFYLFGIPFIKEVKKEHNTYYKLFGLIRVLKKAVRG